MTITPSFSHAKLEYIEEMGLLMEDYGFSRMAGRVLGALLVSEPAEQTAEDLASALQASRSSISVAIRLLEKLGYVERVSRPGERKDYFRNRPNAWATQLAERQLIAIRQLREVADKGLALLETDDADSRLGLEEMREFYAFMEREHPRILKSWRERREGGGNAAAEERPARRRSRVERG